MTTLNILYILKIFNDTIEEIFYMKNFSFSICLSSYKYKIPINMCKFTHVIYAPTAYILHYVNGSAQTGLNSKFMS